MSSIFDVFQEANWDKENSGLLKKDFIHSEQKNSEVFK